MTSEPPRDTPPMPQPEEPVSPAVMAHAESLVERDADPQSEARAEQVLATEVAVHPDEAGEPPQVTPREKQRWFSVAMIAVLLILALVVIGVLATM